MFIFIAALTLAGCSHKDSDELVIHPPAGWKLSATSTGRKYYLVKSPTGSMLTFSKWPVPSDTTELTNKVREVSDIFVRSARSGDLKLKSEKYVVEQFAGPNCHGSFTTFQTQDQPTNFVEVIFMMSVDGRIWNGQFAGYVEQWKQTVKVLKDIKSKGKMGYTVGP